MILADTSVWADHLRLSEPILAELLVRGEVVMHPFVLGEIALGHIRKRSQWMLALSELPAVHVADPEEVLQMIEQRKLVAQGVGYVDVHLLATTLTSRGVRLWSRDKRLRDMASEFGIAARLDH